MKHFWLYALKLEQDKFYIGITAQKDPQRRINQHKNGSGARWTKLYKPTETLELRDLGSCTEQEAKLLENELTYSYIDRYGIGRVRGGRMTYTGKIFKVWKYYIPKYALFSLYTAVLLFILSGYVFWQSNKIDQLEAELKNSDTSQTVTLDEETTETNTLDENALPDGWTWYQSPQTSLVFAYPEKWGEPIELDTIGEHEGTAKTIRFTERGSDVSIYIKSLDYMLSPNQGGSDNPALLAAMTPLPADNDTTGYETNIGDVVSRSSSAITWVEGSSFRGAYIASARVEFSPGLYFPIEIVISDSESYEPQADDELKQKNGTFASRFNPQDLHDLEEMVNHIREALEEV